MLRVLTVGHSDHPFDHFIGLIKLHKIDVVADTRSYPYSNFAPQYDRDALRNALKISGVKYVFLGKELGGRPSSTDYYDDDGHVLYAKVSLCESFSAGIKRLHEGMKKYNVALLCAEENPATCHRRLLVGRVLVREGVDLRHIRGDGRIETETELSERLASMLPQMNLFKKPENEEWKSIPSVLRKRRQASSSSV